MYIQINNMNYVRNLMGFFFNFFIDEERKGVQVRDRFSLTKIEDEKNLDLKKNKFVIMSFQTG